MPAEADLTPEFQDVQLHEGRADVGPVEEFEFKQHRMYMVFSPKFMTAGRLPYGRPSGDPNNAIRSAVIKHFGDNGFSMHQIMAMWRFLQSRGFECKRILSMSARNYRPACFDKDVV